MSRAFEKLEAQIAQTKEVANEAREHFGDAMEAQKDNSVKFTGVIAVASAVFLVLIALLFDYLVILNPLLARIDIWIFVVIVLFCLSRMFVIWVMMPAHMSDDSRALYRHAMRQLAALERYEAGSIDERNIRELYTEVRRASYRLLSSRVIRAINWSLYMLFLLGASLFALIFA